MDFRSLIDLVSSSGAPLTEGKQVGIVYHFTDFHSAFSIITDDEMRPKEGDGGIEWNGGAFVIDRARDWVSFTRNHNLFATRAAGGSGKEWGVVRLAFDGDKLAQRARMQPYHDQDDYLTRHDGQAEERVVGNVKGIRRALIQIDFMLDRHMENETNFDDWVAPPDEDKRVQYTQMARDDVAFMTKWFKETGVPFNIVQNFRTPARR